MKWTQDYIDFRHRAEDYQQTIHNTRDASTHGGPSEKHTCSPRAGERDKLASVNWKTQLQ